MSTYTFKKIIKVERIFTVEIVDYSHSIPFYSIIIQKMYSMHNFSKRRQTLLSPSVLVMDFLRTIYRHADEPIILFQELAPLFCKQRAVCLYAIIYLSATSIFLLKRHRSFIKRQRPHQRLTTMPSK